MMPWTPEEFRSRHNKSLTPEQAKKASAQANAILREGGDEGTAIATANKHARDGASKAKDNRGGRRVWMPR